MEPVETNWLDSSMLLFLSSGLGRYEPLFRGSKSPPPTHTPAFPRSPTARWGVALVNHFWAASSASDRGAGLAGLPGLGAFRARGSQAGCPHQRRSVEKSSRKACGGSGKLRLVTWHRDPTEGRLLSHPCNPLPCGSPGTCGAQAAPARCVPCLAPRRPRLLAQLVRGVGRPC